MKKILIVLLSLVLILNFAACNSDDKDSTSDNDTPKVTANPATDFEYHVENDYIFIDKYIGNGKEVIVPSMIDGKPVEIIGLLSFEYSDVISVTLPFSLIWAFNGLDEAHPHWREHQFYSVYRFKC